MRPQNDKDNTNVLIAYDCSGSTSRVSFYHDKVRKIVADYRNNPNVTVVAWDDKWKTISLEELDRINRGLLGYGGTDVSKVAEALMRLDFRGKLVLITDGQVWGSDIDECDGMMSRFEGLTDVRVHLIGSGANMSVSCPFTRRCPHEVSTYDETSGVVEMTVSVTDEDRKVLDDLDDVGTIDAFETRYETLSKVLTARMMGKADIDTKIHDKLVALRKRLVRDMARAKTTSGKDLIEKLAGLARDGEGSWEDALATFAGVTRNYYTSSSESWEKKVSALLEITKGGLRNTFCHRLRRADEVVAVPLESIELADPVDEDGNDWGDGGVGGGRKNFECPITLEDECDMVLLVKDVGPLFDTHADRATVEDVLNCPLNAFKHPKLVEGIANALDSVCGARALTEADKAGAPITSSPFTRADLAGALYFGDHPTQAAATNRTMAVLLTGGVAGAAKKTGNMDLWVAVVYSIMKEKEWFRDVLPFVERHLKRRLANGTTYASMTGITKYLTTRVSLGLACWMVAASPFLHLPTERDMSRAHAHTLVRIADLAAMAGFALPEDARARLAAHARRLGVLYKLLYLCKKQGVVLGSRVRALYQRCVRIDPTNVGFGDDDAYCSETVEWIPIDGPADDGQKRVVLFEFEKRYRIAGCSPEELVGLYAMVGPNASADAIRLDVDWVPPALPEPSVAWEKYGLSTTTVANKIPICAATCRPYYYVSGGKGGGDTWVSSFERTYEVDVGHCFSGNACFIRFVEKYGRYPDNADEFLEFLYYYHCVHREFPTLPAPVSQFAREIWNEHRELTKKVPAEVFAARTNASMNIEKRVQIEAIDRFVESA